MRYHHSNTSRGKLPLWRGGRAWLGKLHWQWVVFQRRSGFGVSIDSRGFHVCLLAFALYVRYDDDDCFDRRELSLSIHDGIVWITHPWVRPNEWRRADPWWRKQVALHVVDWILGRVRHSSTEKNLPDVYVPLPEGCYRAKAKAVTHSWWRRFGWFRVTRESVELDVDGGIPFAGKGESGWDCEDDGLCGWSGSSVENAIARGVESVIESRSKRGHDSAGTGREPAIVVNSKEASR